MHLPLAIALNLAFAAAALGLEPAVPLSCDTLPRAERTQILVLAGPHLESMLDQQVDLGLLDPLLAALERFAPDLIAIERLPGETVDAWLQASPRYDAMLNSFAPKARRVGGAAQKAAGLTYQEALTEGENLIQSMMRSKEAVVESSLRARAALLLAALHDFTSAALQWSLVPESARGGHTLLPPEIASELQELLATRAEYVTIGLTLARRLGHQRVFPIDDQCDAQFQLEHGGQLMKELQETPEFKRLNDSPFLKDLRGRMGQAVQKRDLLGLYRLMNSQAYGSDDVETQWHIWHRTNLPSGLDRRRAALWEERNLRIAANIRRAAASQGARRILVIIGASHKAFLDAYLRQMMDVEIVDGDTVLEAPSPRRRNDKGK